jgi:hypothetical protein
LIGISSDRFKYSIIKGRVRNGSAFYVHSSTGNH